VLVQELKRGVFHENPVFVAMLGLCPTLAVSVGLREGVAMGVAATFVLVCSNVIVSAIRKFIPSGVRIPAYIVVIAAFVTVVELAFKAYLPEAINAALGIYIPLIVVNCIIFFRAEAYASKNPVRDSAVDGVVMGVGYICSMALISSLREIVGSGTIAGIKVSALYNPMTMMILPPGAFLTVGGLLALVRYLQHRRKERV
jgi:electron transport complex protein RnfE